MHITRPPQVYNLVLNRAELEAITACLGSFSQYEFVQKLERMDDRAYVCLPHAVNYARSDMYFALYNVLDGVDVSEAS